jgi:hypothetical protein
LTTNSIIDTTKVYVTDIMENLDWIAVPPPCAQPSQASWATLENGRDLEILVGMKESGSPDAYIEGNKVYLTSFKITTPQLDPRLYALNPLTGHYYRSTTFFSTRTNSFYCVVTMPTGNAARNFVDMIMTKGIMKCEVEIMTEKILQLIYDNLVISSDSLAITEDLSTNGSSVAHVNGTSNDLVIGLLKKTEKLLTEDVEAMEELAREMDVPYLKYMSREYYKTFNLAMSTGVSKEERLFHYESCNELIRIDKHQMSSGKTDKEMWPLVFTWKQERELAMELLFRGEEVVF